MITTIYLIRHAECQGNIENKLSGITDFKITQKGREQAKLLANKLKDSKITEIYSSPLSRAVDTAKPIMRECHINSLNIVNNLHEINYGICDGMCWTDINQRYPNIKKEWKEIHHYPIGIPNQEEFIELQKRIIDSILKITNDNLGKEIAIISHGIAISSFLCFVKKLNIEACNKLKQQENTAYSILEYKNEKFYLIEESTSEHLKGMVL